MKIGTSELRPLAPTGLASERAPVARGPVVAPEVAASTAVKLDASKAALAASQSEPAFDAAKVERIASAIREGRFEVNAGAIADKLIANAQELLQRKP